MYTQTKGKFSQSLLKQLSKSFSSWKRIRWMRGYDMQRIYDICTCILWEKIFVLILSNRYPSANWWRLAHWWRSQLERSTNMRKVGCSKLSRNRPKSLKQAHALTTLPLYAKQHMWVSHDLKKTRMSCVNLSVTG